MANTALDPSVDDAPPHWHDEPDLYDTITLGGELLPGICSIKVSRKRKIDKKSAKGKNKAKVTVQGYDAAEVTITIRLVAPEDAERLYQLMPLLEPVADRTKVSDKDALDITSYATAYRDLKAVVIEDLEGPELVDGIMVTQLKCVEFHQDPKPKGGGGGAVRCGTFIGDSYDVFALLYVAYQGPPAKGKDGKPLVGPVGDPLFTWAYVATTDANERDPDKGYEDASGSFVGRFLGEDAQLRADWIKAHSGAANKDVTNTPDKSKGADKGGKGGDDNEAPEPITIDDKP